MTVKHKRLIIRQRTRSSWMQHVEIRKEDNNTIMENTFVDNGRWGIWIDSIYTHSGPPSNDNLICGNIIAMNEYGVDIEDDFAPVR